MATNKLIKPTNVTVSIPAFTDQPDQRVNSNCIDKSIDGINALSDQIGNKVELLYTTVSGTTNSNYGYIDLDISTSNYEVLAVRCLNTPCSWYVGSNGKWFAIPMGTKNTDDYMHPLKNESVSLEVVYCARRSH